MWLFSKCHSEQVNYILKGVVSTCNLFLYQVKSCIIQSVRQFTDLGKKKFSTSVINNICTQNSHYLNIQFSEEQCVLRENFVFVSQYPQEKGILLVTKPV
ncbi:hypothetical protein KIL84_017256 [Mauremys mutica]|uniref:Uncharacterized protein n=1 Tax=Mauremys mutica TaxID=74926 RepID=A0A9D3X5Y1_9SAUR|nr:hypothetical protein KIL84_017256 [Mauremys mutica]